MFEDYTYEYLMEDVLKNAPENVDTRQGSIFYDSISGIMLKVAKLYTDIDLIFEMTSVATATGPALDERAGEFGVSRLQATRAKYKIEIVGTTPPVGSRFYIDNNYFSYFTIIEDELAGLLLQAEEPGIGGNNVYEGTNAVPVNMIQGLDRCVVTGIYENGTDDETDEHLRNRVREKVLGESQNGTKLHYRKWCQEVDGIGKARIFPLWNGPNTVKAILIDGVGEPCSPTKVAEVQEYVDPATLGYTTEVDGRIYVVGDGLGEGVANLGAHFTAAAALRLDIDVSFIAEVKSGHTLDGVKLETEQAVKEYLSSLVLDTGDDEELIVRRSAIGAILAGLDSLLDYHDLKINGGLDNITPGEDYVPMVGEVIVDEWKE